MTILLEKQFKKFIHNKGFLFIYPSILVAGVVSSFVIPHRWYESMKDNSWIVSSDNFINKNFAYKGNHVFAIIFTAVFVINLLQEFKSLQTTSINQASGEKSNEDMLMKLSWQKVKNFSIKFTLKIFVLFVLFYIIDHIFVLTGGSCVIDSAVADILAKSSKSLEQCTEYNGTWVRLQESFCLISPKQLSRKIQSAQICYKYGEWEGGFDISGHFCFITTLSLILWYELKELNDTYFQNQGRDIESQKPIIYDDASWFSFTVTNVVRWIVLISLMFWIELLFITATFYHTFLEKILGLTLGYVGPVLFYHILPNIKALHDIMY